MRHLFILFNLMLLFICCLPAQPPGYVGKRAILTFDTYTFPNFFLVLDENYPFRFNYRVGLSGEYVLSRRFSAGLTFNGFQTRTDYHFRGSYGFMRIDGSDVGIFMKSYTFRQRGNIAPIGPYQKLEVLYTRYRMTDLDQLFYPDGRTDLGRSSDLIVGISFGTQHVFGKRITYHWGLHSGWLFKGLDNHRAIPHEQHLKDVSTTRLRGIFGFSINMGVGVLVW
ncbi:MAG: hypothetical protein SF052_00930 [Bacteroidia bacterium]|nr:hypothetical protein [Bacteroidia bacterium]